MCFGDRLRTILKKGSSSFVYPCFELVFKSQIIDRLYGGMDISYGYMKGHNLNELTSKEAGWRISGAIKFGFGVNDSEIGKLFNWGLDWSK